MPAVVTQTLGYVEDILALLTRYGHRDVALVYGAYASDDDDERLWPKFLLKPLRQRGFSPPLAINLYQEPHPSERACLEALLAHVPRPTAVLTHSDEYAVRLMQEAERMGLRVPRDISIIGNGNFEQLRIVTPSLTTVDYRQEVLGSQAVELFISLLIRGSDEHGYAPTGAWCRRHW